MKNQSNVYTKKVNQFERGGDVLAGKTVDNDVKIGAPDSTKHLKNHRVMGTARLGQLLPVDKLHTLPNEDYRVRLSNTVQFEPMYKPILDKLITKMHSFYVGYHAIYGDSFEMFWKGGVDGSYRRELPYYDMSMSGMSTAQKLYLLRIIAFYSWSLSHHMTFDEVIHWASMEDPEDPGTYVFDFDKVSLILNTCFGKGSLLDMFNCGVGNVKINSIQGISELTCPTAIPVDVLLAYKLICNDFYRVDDYQINRFKADDPQAVIFTIGTEVRFESPSAAHGYENLSLGAREYAYGVFFRNLDKIRTQTDVTYDFTIRGYDCHFTPSTLSYRGDIRPLGPNEHSEGIYLSRSCCALAWLLAVEPVPLPKDYLTMILPQTQRGLISGLGNLPLRTIQNSDTVALSVLASDSERFLHLNSNDLVSLSYPVGGTSGRSLYTSLDMETIRYINSATKLAEKMNIVGENYGQQLLAEFGINPKFANIDKPLYLGGLTTTPRVEKVTSTANTEGNAMVGGKLGEYSGDASQFADGSFSFVADDHGFVITIMSTVPEVSYAGFVDRDNFAFFDRMNWFRKEFEDLTEQHLYVNEFKGIDTLKLAKLQAGRIAPTDDDVIGYVPREQQRRTMLSTVHGELIPSKGPKDVIVWTCAKDFNGVNELTTNDILFNSVESAQNKRLFQFDPVQYPPMTFECGFNVDVLSKVGRITMPITI